MGLNSHPGKACGLVQTLVTTGFVPLYVSPQRICNHAALVFQEQGVSQDFGRRSAKLQRLEEILDELMAVGNRALLFTQVARWGHLLKQY